MQRRLLVLVAAAALLASGCFKVNLDIEVEEDGSGRLGGIVAIDFAAFEDLAGSLGEDSGLSRGELCGEFDTESGFNTSELDQARPYDEDGFCGVEFETAFAADEFDETFGSLESGEGTLRRDGDGWFFELPFDESEFETGDASAFPGVEELFGDAEYVVRVKLPGRQVDHNGTRIDDEGFVVWDLDLTSPPDRLFLRTEPGDPITGSGGGGTGAVILIVILVLLALGAVAYFLMRRRGDHETPPASGVAATIPYQAPTAPPITTAPASRTDVTAPLEPMTSTTSSATSLVAEDVAAEDMTARAEPAEQAAPEPAEETAPEPAEEAAPQVIAGPTPEQATGAPVWDPARRKYVQWDPNHLRWLVFDDATQSWGPEQG